jgi:ADP-ribose pyrophosphatase YjhB (NUDIX family)
MEFQATSRPVPPVPPPVRSRPSRIQKKRIRPRRRVERVRRPKQPKKIRRELSAGGVVVRQDRGQWFVALLKTEHRRGEVWVLPKGHVEMERRETIADAAKREVQEEAGVQDINIKCPLGITRFVFQAEEALVKKTVHYFLMVTEREDLTPQAEEGFVEAGWFPISIAITMLEYDTDQDIVSKAQSILDGKPLEQRTSRRSIKIHS